MYVRVYNHKLVKVYSEEDLNSSDMISTLKGRNLAGFTIRDEEGNVIFYDGDVISSVELQMIIRNLNRVTVAINMSDEEVLDYFYEIAKDKLMENGRNVFNETELYEWMNATIDSGILKSEVWRDVKDELFLKLLMDGFRVVTM